MAVSASYGYETPYLRSLGGLEYQIIVLDAISWLFWTSLGPKEIKVKASVSFSKSVWKNIRNKSYSIFDKLLQRDQPKTPRPEGTNPSQYDDWLWEYINQDWNDVFDEIGKSGTVMGYLAGYLSGNLKLPDERISRMSIQDYDVALKHRLGYGLDDFSKLQVSVGNDRLDKERLFALAYAKREGGRWLAIYDEDGNHSGRAYDLITQLYRAQISQALENGETVEQLQSRMAFPDLLSLLEKGEITEDEYLEYSEKHLNRDFRRFALTEASYAWNNGKLSETADREAITGRPQYLEFVTGGGGGVL